MSKYGGNIGGGSGSSSARGDYGGRVDWVSTVATKIQPGSRTMDDGTVLEWTAKIDIVWGDLDTGSEANSTAYYLWVYDNGGSAAGAISLSATAPTGITDGKWLAGWFYNDSSGDILEFRTAVFGDVLRYSWLDSVTTNRVVDLSAAAQPTSFTEVNCSSGTIRCPVARVVALQLICDTNNSVTIWFSADGNATASGANGTSGSPGFAFWLNTEGPSFWWKKSASTGATTRVEVLSFDFDRSGVTYG